jgi:hypoxanthine phosphoribosyltransferase
MSEDTRVVVSDKQFRTLISRDTIAQRVKELGATITRDFGGKNPILIGVLKGSTIFLSDLARELDFECELTFLRVSSYHGGTGSSGKITRDMFLKEDIRDRHVLVVEDIIDTGKTAVYLFEELGKMKPASLKMATLLYKPAASQHNFKPDYTAFEIGNEFVVGYGLDYKEYGRNLKEIFVLDEK